MRPSINVVCDVAAKQGGGDPAAIRKFVAWAESTKFERTRWESGE
ncbi:hypothetical protein AKJ09_06383 [Labilithrix luteola]|uniref:Uncharacterized protein n=1 Tax=Labilithrix luteola TaxID=1391654 RepID=A0A0K1Q2X5_9BACT|nr:hypothetical protein AKJ09_06383 [Labilithrix luteola]